MFAKFITAFSLLLCFSNYAAAETAGVGTNKVALMGDWQGKLDLGMFSSDLRLFFHITKTKDGYTSTLDSPDQGARGIATETTILDGNNLLITSPVIGAEYRATIIGDKITGIWSQYGDEFPELTLNRVIADAPVQKNQEPAVIVGDWEGTLQRLDLTSEERVALFLMGKNDGLRLVFHISRSKDGYTTTLDSLDQDAKGIPTEKTILNGNSITITSPLIGGRYEATITGDKMTGIWSQYGDEFPELTLSRMNKKSP
ncbi:MAG: hypothetical protein ACI808_000759 [Paraglaciecola sp.]|jgi:hypothetical protein